MPGVATASLTKRFGRVVAVDDISMDIPDGKFTTLLGPSGCGKTTTLRLIGGFEKPDKGQVKIGESVVVSAEEKVFIPPERRGIGMVFQSYAIWPHMKVFDNVAYPLRERKTSVNEIKERVSDTLELVKLEGLEERYPSELSGGQQQRVALARALVYKPQVLLLDEPLSNLDAKLRERMRIELRSLQTKLGITTIYVTHDQSEALSMSDKVAVMNAGKILETGSPRQIYEHPSHRFTADFIGATNFLTGRIAGDNRVETELGNLESNIPREFKSSIRILISFRPHDVELHKKQPTDPTNVFEGIVDAISYVGDRVVYELKAGSQRIRAYTNPSFILNLEDRCYARVPPEACAVLSLEE